MFIKILIVASLFKIFIIIIARALGIRSAWWISPTHIFILTRASTRMTKSGSARGLGKIQRRAIVAEF